jgi:hypothetical protein
MNGYAMQIKSKRVRINKHNATYIFNTLFVVIVIKSFGSFV